MGRSIHDEIRNDPSYSFDGVSTDELNGSIHMAGEAAAAK